MPTPITALIRGIPAASSEPKVMNSTTPAKSTPKTSVTVIPTVLSANTWPPNSTCNPASSPTDAVVLSSSMVAWVTSADEPTSCTRMIAIPPSALTAFPAYSLKGLSAESTPGTSEIAVTIFSMVAFSSAMDDPSGATTTAVALAPATEGNTASSRSRASCDSVPGITNDS